MHISNFPVYPIHIYTQQIQNDKYVLGPPPILANIIQIVTASIDVLYHKMSLFGFLLFHSVTLVVVSHFG